MTSVNDWLLKPNWKHNAVWTENFQKLSKLMGITMDCENIFNTKKERGMACTISIHYLEFAIFAILT